MAISTANKVEQQLGDLGVFVSVNGVAYAPMPLIMTIIDGIAPDAAFTKTDAQKYHTEYQEELATRAEANRPRPVELQPAIISSDPVKTVPYTLYLGAVETNGQPVYPGSESVIVHVPESIPTELRREYALTVLAENGTAIRTIAPSNSQEINLPAGTIVEVQPDKVLVNNQPMVVPTATPEPSSTEISNPVVVQKTEAPKATDTKSNK